MKSFFKKLTIIFGAILLTHAASAGFVNGICVANGANFSDLTPSQAVVTDSLKNLISLPYSQSASANSLAQRDSDGALTSNYLYVDAIFNLSPEARIDFQGPAQFSNYVFFPNLDPLKLIATDASNQAESITYTADNSPNTVVYRDIDQQFGINNINADTALTLKNGAALRSDTTDAHTALIQGYKVGTGYVTFGTITNGAVPALQFSRPSGTGMTWNGGPIGNLTPATGAFTALSSNSLSVNSYAFTVNGAPTLNDWFDQSVKTTSSPTFNNLYATSDIYAHAYFSQDPTQPTFLINNGSNVANNSVTVQSVTGGILLQPAASKDVTILTSSGGKVSAGLINSSTLTASQAVFTDSSKNLVSTATTGSGNVVLATSPTLVTPALGTPASGNLANCTFPTLNQNTTGSAATLTTPRNINGVPFNGSADITVQAAAGTLTGSTLASGITASSLTSIGTLGALNISNTGLVYQNITSTTTGTTNEGGLKLTRGDQANGYAQTYFFTGATEKFAAGLRAGDDYFHHYVSGLGETLTIKNDGNVIIGNTLTSPTVTTRLNINNPSSGTSNIVLSGSGFNAGSSAEGVALFTGVNNTNNRQLWIGDSANLAVNSTNGILRMASDTAANGGPFIDAIATDGSTALPLRIAPAGGAVTFTNTAFPPVTFTPSLQDSSAHAYSQTTQYGRYIKIGNEYKVWIWIVWNGKGSAVSTDAVRLTGFPVAPTVSRAACSLGTTSGLGITTQANISADIDSGNTYAWIWRNVTGTSNTMLVSQTNTSGELQMFCDYYV